MTLLWYNPNIHPYTEYHSRLDSLRKFSEENSLPSIIEDEYGLQAFLRAVAETTDAGGAGRCGICYTKRLERTARHATENGFDAFSTSLLISPYQNHELLRQVGEEAGQAAGIEFLYRDFKPLFRKSQNMAKEAGFYMQKYCGCIFSEEERYCPNCVCKSHGQCKHKAG